MTEYVVIRLGAEDQPVQWVLADSNGTRRSGPSTGSLEDAAGEAVGRTVIVLVPATEVLTTTVHMPVRSASKIRTALPYALEENLANDISDLHFASGRRQENGRLPVAVTAHEKMSGWLERLRAVGLTPAQLLPENYGLGKIPGTMSVLIDDNTVMFNDGADIEFVMQDVKPSDVLIAAGRLGEQENDNDNDNDKHTGHLIAFCTPEQDEQLSHDWITLRHELQSVDVNILPDGVLPKLAVTIAAGHGVNLLQGQYGEKSEYSSYFKPWKTAAILLLILVMTGLTSKGVDYYRLLEEESALREQFNAEYQILRPNDTREILDPINTVASLRRGMGASTTPQLFLPSLRELGAAMAANSAAQIEGISYRAGVVDVRLTSPDVATLDSIQKAVSASGQFRASIQSTNQVGDKIDGRIQIRESGS